jgi:gas vesicle protein
MARVNSTFITGLVVGTVIGVGLGLLFAPASGEEIRSNLKSKSSEFKDSLAHRIERLRERVAGLAGAVKQRTEELSQRLRPGDSGSPGETSPEGGSAESSSAE